ncbi:Ig-like domain-containing protein [Methanobrevibacter sp.]|uniref:Ig-like domain-containing protein n=1 Tax=Methanobrevibacter sp. TaxID=66852 RepID=UPI0026DEF8D9|nr:Ig-like domain-containing protein [Methanobrevibacter sp.]MDO5859874.1 Ig-like domain-containing protein [Methanobrevibacter sp.]
MQNRKLMVLAIILTCLFAISAVSAAENATDEVVSLDDAIEIESPSNDVVGGNEPATELSVNVESEVNDENTVNSSFEYVGDGKISSSLENQNILSSSPPYYMYNAHVQGTAINYGSSGSIFISYTPSTSSSYSYKYDFYLKVYDSNNVEKISKRYYGTSTSSNNQYYSIGATSFDPGVYTVKLINSYDNHVMSTSTLTVYSVHHSLYSVSVSDTNINYGSTGSITMSISPASGSYLKYDFYLKIYDYKNAEKVSKRYYSTSSSRAVTYNIYSSSFGSGSYTIKIISNQDNYVMSSAKLNIYALTYSSYSVRVSNTNINYGYAGSIKMSISPASSSYYNKYDFYLKIYDSNNVEKVSQRYYSTSSSNSASYSYSSTAFSPGNYTIKIINSYDNHVMSTATLSVKRISLETQNLVGNCNEIMEYKVRASENGEYKSGLNIIFDCNGDEYNRTTDNQGYATLKIHLKAGTYHITTKYSNIEKQNTITVNTVYVANQCKDAYVKSLTGYYGGKYKIKYGLKGNLEGYFRIYKGNKVIYQTKFNSNGYIDDYFKYTAHNKKHSLSKMGVGTYRAVLTDSNGKAIAKGTISIVKSPTHIKCSSFVIKVGSKRSINVYVYDKFNSRKGVAGAVQLKINGKVYGAKVKNGVAVVRNVKFPLNVKTYNGYVKFLENKNYKASSAKFKVSARKLTSVMYSDSISTKTGVKNTLKVYVGFKDFDWNIINANSGTVKFTLNGETYYAKVKNGYAQVTVTAPYSAGTYTCKAVYLGSDSVKKSSTSFQMVVKKKSNLKTAVLPVYYHEFVTKRLSNKDVINVFYEDTPRRQYSMGVSVWATHGYGLVEPKYTKLVSSKVWFMNDETGGVITRTSSNVRYDYIHIGFIRGYTPYKVQVWYK